MFFSPSISTPLQCSPANLCQEPGKQCIAKGRCCSGPGGFKRFQEAVQNATKKVETARKAPAESSMITIILDDESRVGGTSEFPIDLEDDSGSRNSPIELDCEESTTVVPISTPFPTNGPPAEPPSISTPLSSPLNSPPFLPAGNLTESPDFDSVEAPSYITGNENILCGVMKEPKQRFGPILPTQQQNKGRGSRLERELHLLFFGNDQVQSWGNKTQNKK